MNSMRKISIKRLLKETKEVLREVAAGQAFVITRRGRPVARLEPIVPPTNFADDPIYRLDELATERLEPLINAEIDRTVYGT